MYVVKTTSNFDKQFKKLDRSVQRMIAKWIRNHLENCTNPRATGKGLVANVNYPDLRQMPKRSELVKALID